MANKNKNKGKKDLAAALGKAPVAPVVEKEVVAPAVAEAAPKETKAKAKETKAPEAAPKVTEDVTDANGRVMFRRVTGGTPLVTPHKVREQIKTKPSTRFQKAKIPGNPSTLAFPTDRWGVTKDLKKAVIELASRIAGDTRKMELTEEVLEILVQHLKDKFAVDKKIRDKRLEEYNARNEALKAAAEAVEPEAE